MTKFLLVPFFLLFGLMAQAQNMISNGNFEDDFTGWTNLAGDGAEAAYSVESQAQHVQAGSKALKVVITTLGTNPWSIQSMGPTWSSVEGTEYKLSFYAKAATEGARMKAVQQVGASYAEREFTLTTSWALYEWTFTAGAPNLQLKFNYSNAGTYYLDNVSIMVPGGTLSAGKDINTANHVNVYPNPVNSGSFTIELNQFDARKKVILQLVDVQGRLLVVQEVTTDLVRVEQNLKAGIYFVRLLGAEGVVTKKLIVN